MPRLMSVAYTVDAVNDRSKMVTRRVGWRFVKAGDLLQLCRKVQGRRRSDGTVEPLDLLAVVHITGVRREPLRAIYSLPAPDIETLREGVPGVYTVDAFVEFYCNTFGVTPDTEITRIEWEYNHA